MKKARYILVCGALMAVLAACSARPTIYADDDPIFQEVAAMQADDCRLLHGEQAVVRSERIDVTVNSADAIEITLHRSILFGKGAMGGIPQLSFSFHPARGEEVSITQASARVPQGPAVAPVFAENIPPSATEALTDPDVRKVMVQFVMPQGGVVDITVKKRIQRLSMLPGVSAVVMSGLPFRRCSVSAAITHPVSQPVHVRSAFSPEAAVAVSTKEPGNDLVETRWIVEALPASLRNDVLLEVSTVFSWQSLGQALKEGFIRQLDADAESLSIGTKGMTPQQVLQKVQSMAGTCPRRALSDADFMLPLPPKTTADWGCGACRDLSALLALGLRQAGYIPNLVFVRPAVGLSEDFPTDNLTHVIVSVFHKLKMLYFDPTIPGAPGALHPFVAGTRGLVVPLVPHPDVVPTLMRIPPRSPQGSSAAVNGGDPAAWRMHLHDVVGVNNGTVSVTRTFKAMCSEKTATFSTFEIPCHSRNSTWTPGVMTSGDMAVPQAFVIESGSGPGALRPHRKKHLVIPGGRLGQELSGSYTLNYATDSWGEIETPSGGIVSGWTRELSNGAEKTIALVTSDRFGVNNGVLPRMPAKTDVAVPGDSWRPRGMVWALRNPGGQQGEWSHLGNMFNDLGVLRENGGGKAAPTVKTNISWGLSDISTENALGDALLYGSPWSDMAQRGYSGFQSRLALLIPCLDAGCSRHQSYFNGMPVVLLEDEMGSDIVQPFLNCSPLDILDGAPAILVAEQKEGQGAVEEIELISQAVEPSNLSIQIKILFDEQGEASIRYGMAASGSARCMVSSCRDESHIPPSWVLMKKRDRSLIANWNAVDSAQGLQGGYIYDVVLPFAECPHFFSNNSIKMSVMARVPAKCTFRSKSYRKSHTIGDGREEISLHTTKSNVTFHQTRYWGEIRPERSIRNMGLTLEYECYGP